MTASAAEIAARFVSLSYIDSRALFYCWSRRDGSRFRGAAQWRELAHGALRSTSPLALSAVEGRSPWRASVMRDGVHDAAFTAAFDHSERLTRPSLPHRSTSSARR